MWKRDETVTLREGHQDRAAGAAAVVSRTPEKVSWISGSLWSSRVS